MVVRFFLAHFVSELQSQTSIFSLTSSLLLSFFSSWMKTVHLHGSNSSFLHTKAQYFLLSLHITFKIQCLQIFKCVSAAILNTFRLRSVHLHLMLHLVAFTARDDTNTQVVSKNRMKRPYVDN